MRSGCLLCVTVGALIAAALPARAESRGRSGPTLLSGRSYRDSFRAARRVLEGRGGLVRLKPDLPTVVIPDLHGRRDYLDAVLATRDPGTGRSYLQMLQQGRVQVLCLGDVMHTEKRGTHWRRGMPEPVMRAEMAESLGTLKRIADLKAAHPEHFHLLRGNHDDVGPASGDGQLVRCLPRQIALTRQFLGGRFGGEWVGELACFFSALPVAAKGSGFVASHAAPMVPVSKRQVERNDDRAAASLARVRVPAFRQLRARAPLGDSRAGTLRQVARALGADPERDYYVHGHIWARPMAIRGNEVFFGHPQDRTFLRLDPNGSGGPWTQLFEAGTGRQVPVSPP
jgi:hypothetical protein